MSGTRRGVVLGIGPLHPCKTKFWTLFNLCVFLPRSSPQRWKRKASFIQHSVSGLCLEAKPAQLVTSKCQADVPAQQWQLLPHT